MCRKTKFVTDGAADDAGVITIHGDGGNLSQINGLNTLTLIPMISGVALNSGTRRRQDDRGLEVRRQLPRVRPFPRSTFRRRAAAFIRNQALDLGH